MCECALLLVCAVCSWMCSDECVCVCAHECVCMCVCVCVVCVCVCVCVLSGELGREQTMDI